MTNPATKTLSFSVLIENRQGAFVGHCLETGLVATALDEADVLSKMGKLLVRLVTFAAENGRIGDIYHSAPKEIWDKWIRAEEHIISSTRSSISERVGGSQGTRFNIDQTAYAATC